MENASKALIIAGAILLSILLISLGIMIFNQAQDTVSDSGMSEAQITAFNNKFLKYESTSTKGTMVKSLVEEVNATNSSSSNNDSIRVTINAANANKGKETNTYYTSKIVNNKSYSVKLEYGTNGRVNNIVIKQGTTAVDLKTTE